LLQGVWPSRDELQRTLDWVAPQKPVKKTSQKPADAEYVTSSISEHESNSKFDLPIRKEKPKTRGSADGPATAPAEPAFPHEASTPPAPRFTIGKRAYHTFSTLFFKPCTDSQPGEVPWTDFVSAMSAINFMPEKLFGSVWRFAPKSGSLFGTEMPFASMSRILYPSYHFGRRDCMGGGWRGIMGLMEIALFLTRYVQMYELI
jgi:hypothetical protein